MDKKVIKGLECCASMDGNACRECPYSSECVAGEAIYQTGTAHLAADALALLKEQEVKYGNWINPTSQDCHCSECGEQPVHEPGEPVPLYDYCPYCGAKMGVKWK